ncbi:MAG: PocR ligand-binding domain-containing protein [Anaerolineae bacterium]|nr:PocR ligand-binding domain-containing protein [Anaerolineae bacterium]
MTTPTLRDRFIDLIDDVDAFKRVLQEAFHDWHGSFDVLMEETNTYLFEAKHSSAHFCPFCAKLRSTPEGERRCKAFDEMVHRKLKDGTYHGEFYICHAGLADTAVPIVVDGVLVATILFGQVLIEEDEAQSHFAVRAQALDDDIGFAGALHEVAEQVYIAKLGADRLKLRDRLHREGRHLKAAEIVRLASEQVNDVQLSWEDFWVHTARLMERMRRLIGAACGMVLVPGQGDYSGEYVVSCLCGLPVEPFYGRRYALPTSLMDDLKTAAGVVVKIDDQPGLIRQSILQDAPEVGTRIDKVFMVKLDLRYMGEGLLVYFINNEEDVAHGSLKIDNGDSIERTTLAQFASVIALAFSNRRIHERSKRIKNERREWMEKISHQIVQSVGSVRMTAHGITEWATHLGEINAHAFSGWPSDDMKFFFDRMEEVFYTSNNALRVAQNLKRSVFNPKDEQMEWEWEVEADVPGLMIQIARDFQASAKAHGLRRLHVETTGLAQLNERVRLVVTEELFRQSVANILENAVKYSHRGGEIVINGRIGGGMAVIDVTNEGIQLHPDEIEKVFEYGYRSPRAIKLNAPGTGIGLRVAREIVEFHGGTISALPSVRAERLLDGKATWLTTFTIRLPLLAQRTP